MTRSLPFFNIKYNFTNFFAGLVLLFAGMMAATSASATCVSGCTTTTPAPTPTPVFNYSVGGGALFSGVGNAIFQGTQGYSLTEKAGGASTMTELTAAGNLCGVSCQTGTFKFSGYAWENVNASAGAKSLTSGVLAAVMNQGAAFTSVNFSINKPVAP